MSIDLARIRSCTRSVRAGSTARVDAHHYVDEGTGPPILLCHGATRRGVSCIQGHHRALQDRFRCQWLPDYLGFGLSERPSGFRYQIDERG